MIDKVTVQKIKDTADIVDVVSDYVQLKRSGANFVGLCPFHNERTPSFSVNKARNSCKCFSCGKGGSPVNFLMEIEGISYPEALRQLAQRYGIKIEERELTDEERERQTKREAMMIANEWAMKYFEETLYNTEDGRNIGLSYFYQKRGVTQEACKAFHLGFCPEKGYEFVKAAKERGLRMEVLEQLGLIYKSDKGSYYIASYRGRVIFPFQNSAGKVVGFGARDLTGQHSAKYKNSPETELYKKSYQLYGLYQAKTTIGKEKECFLVEGYLDVIGMWQSGLKNVVASSGTSLTDGQIELIKRFTKNVTVIYDGDNAGIAAALKGVDKLLKYEIDVNVLVLPDGDDPDSFCRKHSSEEVREFIHTNKTDFIHFKIRTLMGEGEQSSQKRYEAILSIAQSIAHIPDRMKRLVYAQDSSILLKVAETDMVREVDRQRYILETNSQKTLSTPLKVPAQAPAPPPESSPSSSQETSPDPDADKPESPQSIGNAMEFLKRGSQKYPLLPLEWSVLRYCIRYGFANFCIEDIKTESGIEQRPINVMEFVDEELAADGIEFSVPVFADIFNLIKTLQSDFAEKASRILDEIELKKEEKMREGYQEIGDRYTSMAEIERAERKLTDSVEEWAANEYEEFAKGFVADELASHELDDVRKLATEALFDRHQLSHIYSRERPAEREEDRLLTLLPTALTVWKNGLLDQQIKILFDRVREIKGKDNIEEEQRILIRLNELMQMRSSMAKNIGDRILLPKGKSK